jgi:hypothetical protein
MKYTVFQIPFPETEAAEKIYCRYAFMGLDRIDKVHLEYYKKSYEGNLETSKTNVNSILEDLFRELNLNHPADYTGHSLSVSDMILIDGHYYFCDSFGWKEVKF